MHRYTQKELLLQYESIDRNLNPMLRFLRLLRDAIKARKSFNACDIFSKQICLLEGNMLTFLKN